MTRLTKIQLRVFNAHLHAFKTATFTTADTQSITELKAFLLEGNTSLDLWIDIRKSIDDSMTRKMVMSDDYFGTLSNKAITRLKVAFKNFLNTINLR